MASAVPGPDQLLAPDRAAFRRETCRRAADVVRDFAELLGQLGPDPSKRIHVNAHARVAVGMIVRLLASGGATVLASRRSLTDAVELDAWVRLLDELLTDAQAAYDRAQQGGPHGRALGRRGRPHRRRGGAVMGWARRTDERQTLIRGRGRLARQVVVTEVRERREVGARRLAAGSQVHLLHRWEHQGVPLYHGLAQIGGGVLEFVGRAWELETAGVQEARP